MRRIALLLMLAALLALPARAHDVPELNRTGIITVTMRYEGKTVAGGELALYRVGDVYEENGNYNFLLREEYASAEIPPDKLLSAETARKLASIAGKQSIDELRTIDGEGKACFDALKPGLYLIVQKKAAKGFEKVSPFLVTLPMTVGGTYQYQVDASPKVSLVRKEQETNPEQPKTGDSGWMFWIFPLSAAALLVLTRKRFRP